MAAPNLGLWLALFFATGALCHTSEAALPPSDYRLEVVADHAQILERLNAQGSFRQAIEQGKLFQRSVSSGALVSYELAFAYRALGELKPAEEALKEAVALDPSLSFAWYDLGELALIAGDRPDAERAFAEAARLRPDHWAGFFRLAELAAESGDAERFDALLTKAIVNGFDLRSVTQDPRWRGWYADPVLGQILRRFLVVYWRSDVLDAFEAPLQ